MFNLLFSGCGDRIDAGLTSSDKQKFAKKASDVMARFFDNLSQPGMLANAEDRRTAKYHTIYSLSKFVLSVTCNWSWHTDLTVQSFVRFSVFF